MTPKRVVSLVPSLTEAVAAFGAAGRLVGVTRYCTLGVPPGAERVGGTKNPDTDRIVALAPDLVLANAEENREEDLHALRAAGIEVLVTLPRTVADVPPMLADVGRAVGAGPAVADGLAARVAQALDSAVGRAPRPPLTTLTLVWRKPWMGVGPDTYLSDLLSRCGFANVLGADRERYPRLGNEDVAAMGKFDVVLLPSEPYAFTDDDLPAVGELTGGVPHRFVDGRLLTWHGPSTPAALDRFACLAAEVAAALG